MTGRHPSGPSRRLLLLGIVFLVALAIRAAYVVDLSRIPMFGHYTMDAGYHHEWALSIRDGNAEAQPFFRAPLYPYFLALVYGVLGTSPWVILMLQALLGAATCVLAAWLAAAVFGRGPALLTGLLLAAYWPLIYYSGELLVETLAVFLYLCGLAVLARSPARRRRHRTWFVAGVFVGLGIICRPSLMIFVPVPLLGLLVEKRRPPLRTAVRPALLFLAAIVICIAPVTAHNVIVGDDWVLIGWYDGINFYIGNNPQSDGATAIAPDTRASWWGGHYDAYETAERAAGRSLKPSEFSRYWQSEALRFLFGSPGEAAKLYLLKIRILFSAIERSNNLPLEFFRRQSPFLSLPWFGYGLLLPLAAYGAWRERRRWRRLHVLYGFLLTYAAGMVAFFVNARFRLPLTPVMGAFAGAGLAHLLWLVRRPKARAAAGAVAVLGGAVLLSQLPSGARATRLHEAQGHTIVGNAHLERGEATEALAAFRRAADALPNMPGALAGQGAALLALGDTLGAARAYEEEVRRYPNDSRSVYSLGRIAAARGDTTLAIQRYQEALRLRPIPRDASDILYNLGNIYLRRLDFPAARSAYEAAISSYPSNAQAHNNLGMLHIRLRNLEEAETAFRRAIEIAPDYAGAYVNLGLVAILNQDRRGARAAFERALEIDPTLLRAREALERLE